MQKSYDYHFVTHWRVEATAQEVTDILDDALDLVRWWPDVYLRELCSEVVYGGCLRSGVS